MNHSRYNNTVFGRGFTVIEMLVSIAIISLLVSFLLPVLGNTKNQSQKLASSANLRSIGQLFELYINNSEEYYPAPIATQFYQTPRGWQQIIHHWAMSDQWHSFLSDKYPWQHYKKIFLAPGAQRDISDQPVMAPVLPSYQYSASFLGHPTIWTDREITDDQWPRLERSVKRTMVRFTSSKALMWDIEMPYIRRPLEKDASYNLLENTPMLFADQHVANRIPADASQAIFNRATNTYHPIQKLHNTPNGVYGRDY